MTTLYICDGCHQRDLGSQPHNCAKIGVFHSSTGGGSWSRPCACAVEPSCAAYKPLVPRVASTAA